MRWLPVLALVSMTMSATAHAGLLPDGGVTAQDVASVLRAKGYQADITTDKEGDPLVRSNSSGAKFGVFFYECKGKPRCKSIQFSAGFNEPGLDPAKIADWNRRNRFGRAWIDKDGDPFVEMDVDVEHGATVEALANDLDRWVSVMGAFMRYLGR